MADPQIVVMTADTVDYTPCAAGKTMPRFRGGGLDEFRRWVQAHLRKYDRLPTEHPELHGLVASFVIDTTGHLGDIRILESACRAFSQEAVRVLELSPRWEPGYRRTGQGRVEIAVKYTMPVDFRP